MNLTNELKDHFLPVLATIVPDVTKVDSYLGMIKASADAKHGDYQANFCMALAKVLGKKPPELAKEIVGQMPEHPMIDSASVAGPGFINIKLNDGWIAEQLRTIATDDRLGVAKVEKPRKFVIDLSGPNVAKPLHVGHLRSTIIGDALVRVLRFLGHTVISDNHLGDWGTQFGILIHGYKNHLNEISYQMDPVRELARLYVEVRAASVRTVTGQFKLPEANVFKINFQSDNNESPRSWNMENDGKLSFSGGNYSQIICLPSDRIGENTKIHVRKDVKFLLQNEKLWYKCAKIGDVFEFISTTFDTDAVIEYEEGIKPTLDSFQTIGGGPSFLPGMKWLVEATSKSIKLSVVACDVTTSMIMLKGVAHKVTQGVDPDDEAVDITMEACRQETAKLHAGDPENLALWHKFMPACLDMLKPIYERLDVKIDHAHGESFYNPMLADVVKDLVTKQIAVESNGALVVPNAKGIVPTAEQMETEEPPALIRKKDGAFTYTTTDLATVKYRVDTWQPDVMLYVVDARQALHFRTLFANARRWGYDQVEFQHVMFGSILGKDRKPLRTRDGGTVELESLLDEAAKIGLEKYEQSHNDRKSHGHDVPDLTDETKRNIAETVGYGAVKYADLGSHRTNDYIFDFDKMLATEGNTGTYMQYAYARCRSIFRKGNVDEITFRSAPPAVQLTHAAERALGLQLLKFEEVLTATAAEYLPHYITQYLWDVAKAFSGFFENCPVLTAPTDEVKLSRLLLVDLTARIIRQSLELLGIRTVERM